MTKREVKLLDFVQMKAQYKRDAVHCGHLESRGSGDVRNVAGAAEVEGNMLMVHVMDGSLLWLTEVVCDG
jgi:hypothetical protein